MNDKHKTKQHKICAQYWNILKLECCLLYACTIYLNAKKSLSQEMTQRFKHGIDLVRIGGIRGHVRVHKAKHHFICKIYTQANWVILNQFFQPPFMFLVMQNNKSSCNLFLMLVSHYFYQVNIYLLMVSL